MRGRLLYWRCSGPFQIGGERSLDAASLGARATTGSATRRSADGKPKQCLESF